MFDPIAVRANYTRYLVGSVDGSDVAYLPIGSTFTDTTSVTTGIADAPLVVPNGS